MGNKINDFVKEIKLEEIDPKGIVFFMHAVPGAMGDGGAVDLYSIQNEEVCYFNENIRNGFDPVKLEPYLPEGIYLDRGWFDNRQDMWPIIGGGMGNEFMIKQEYLKDYDKFIEGKSTNFYRGWQEWAEEFLYNMVTNNKKEEKNANKD